ncbi:hypothetical protein YM80_004379 [Salmonella enterica subsp. salamae]|nr:hypothetical protein [Salmonella enterica subsp. salamae]
MPQLLVYTKNSYIKKTINSLIEDTRFVTYFSNRVQFIACATVLNNAILLVDTLHNDYDTIVWINNKLKTNKVKSSVHFIAPESIGRSAFTKTISVISNIMELIRICQMLNKKKDQDVSRNIRDIIIANLRKKLNADEFIFIMTLANEKIMRSKVLTKYEVNSRYYIRTKRLALRNSLEFKQLIQMLSTSDISQC